MRIRTFIAVAAGPEVRHAAQRLIVRLARSADDVKWVAYNNLHWTLQFLGDVEELEIPDVCAAVSAAVAELEPFELEARGAGAFPSADRPRTLWLGAGVGAEKLVEVHRAIQQQLDRLGYRSEHRKFVPHLTLGRAGRWTAAMPLAAELSALAQFDGGSMVVEEVTVYASQLGSEGPTYEPLAHVPLGS